LCAGQAVQRCGVTAHFLFKVLQSKENDVQELH
jgi:hypothetical protein